MKENFFFFFLFFTSMYPPDPLVDAWIHLKITLGPTIGSCLCQWSNSRWDSWHMWQEPLWNHQSTSVPEAQMIHSVTLVTGHTTWIHMNFFPSLLLLYPSIGYLDAWDTLDGGEMHVTWWIKSCVSELSLDRAFLVCVREGRKRRKRDKMRINSHPR